MPCSDHAIAAKPSWFPSLLATQHFTTQEVLDDREECKPVIINRDEDPSSGGLIHCSARQKRKSVLATEPPGNPNIHIVINVHKALCFAQMERHSLPLFHSAVMC